MFCDLLNDDFVVYYAALHNVIYMHDMHSGGGVAVE